MSSLIIILIYVHRLLFNWVLFRCFVKTYDMILYVIIQIYVFSGHLQSGTIFKFVSFVCLEQYGAIREMISFRRAVIPQSHLILNTQRSETPLSFLSLSPCPLKSVIFAIKKSGAINLLMQYYGATTTSWLLL